MNSYETHQDLSYNVILHLRHGKIRLFKVRTFQEPFFDTSQSWSSQSSDHWYYERCSICDNNNANVDMSILIRIKEKRCMFDKWKEMSTLTTYSQTSLLPFPTHPHQNWINASQQSFNYLVSRVPHLINSSLSEPARSSRELVGEFHSP